MGRRSRSVIAVLLLMAMLVSIIPINLSVFAESGDTTAATDKDEHGVTEEGYLTGYVKLVKAGSLITSLQIGKGEKDYIYTELGEGVGADVKYTWQILISNEKNRWATINDYLLSYAVISEALIENQPNQDGYATIRCVVDDGARQYVSGSVVITKKPLLMFATGPSNSSASEGDPIVSGETSSDAFQIVVNYIFRHATAPNVDAKTAASPFTITLPNTASYTGTVASPPVLGYTPYILDENGSFEYDGQKYTHADYYSFNKQHETITVTIHYIPDIVNYMVKYYEQNLYNDEYTYAGTAVKTGYSDTKVGAGLDEHRDGFKALAYDKDTIITGDGDAAVDIYYDRIYCLVDVELGDGAHGVVPYYVRYDTQIILGTPERPGYSFKGWELSELNEKVYADLNEDERIAWEVYSVGSVAGTMLTINQSVATKLLYVAKWEKATTKYSVIYWIENADDDGYTLWGYRQYDATPGDLVSAKDDLPRDDKECFTFNEVRSDKNIIVEGDGTTAVNAYYLRNYYTLLFKAGSTCYVPTHTHGNGCVTPLICGVDNPHTHDDSCGEAKVICGYEEHQHDDACRNTCTIPPHTAHTASCLICTAEVHTQHTTSCYDGVEKTTSTSVEGQTQDGFIGRGNRSYTRNTRYIYISGKWYRYSGTLSYGSQAPTNSKCPGLHTHSEAAGCYKDQLHTHTDHCCSKPVHTHEESCYQYACGIRQHSHSNDCYRDCILYAHSHTGEGNTKPVKAVTAKYEANISDIWPIKVNDNLIYDDGQRWQPSGSSVYKSVLVYMPFMPSHSITFTVSVVNYDKFVMNYYLESLPGETGDKPLDNVQYDLLNTITANYNHLTYEEDFFTIKGFERYSSSKSFTNGQLDITGGGTVDFYYKRNEYELVYNNNGIVVDSESKVFKYQQPIGTEYDVDPAYPSNLEEGGFYFAGWYTTPSCADGTEFKFGSTTMPDNDIILYAKWLPMQYNVKVYSDKTDGELLLDETVYFNSMILEPVLKKDDEEGDEEGDEGEFGPDFSSFIFAGWYYMDGEEEKRFDFNTMMIKKDYVIYAKWTSMVPVDYVIYYRLYHADGHYEDIAEPEKGQALVGITKSFSAKAGEDLYEDFQTGYYPEERSTSLKLDADESKNVYTFIYEHKETIHYSITHNFTDASTAATTGTSLYSILGTNSFSMSFSYEISNASDTPADIVISFRERVTEANIREAIKAAKPDASKSDIDEVWEIVKNLSPDAYEKESILEVDHSDGSNDIRFDWSSRSDACVYQIIYYTQDVGATGSVNPLDDYTIYNSLVFKVDYREGQEVIADILNIGGYVFNPEMSDCKSVGTDDEGNPIYKGSGILKRPTVSNTQPGLIIRLYYDREMLNYVVKHVAGGRVITVNKGPVRYGQTVTELSKDVPLAEDKEYLNKYYVQGSPQKTVEIITDGQEILFTYRLHVINYYYAVVGNGLRGTLSSYTEEVDVNATPVGSIPTAEAGYKFAGWFSDPDGTIPVTPEQANVGALNNTIIPIPSEEYIGTPQYFYAKFVPTTLKIQNSGVSDESRNFVYRLCGIAGTATEGIDLTFALVGNGSITVSALPEGNYVLIPNGDWAYRYDEEAISFTFDENKTVWVNYDGESDKWISDNSYSKIK